ncbi:MAG: hypothetical protein WC493_19145, partial [Zavarzinia sp.]
MSIDFAAAPLVPWWLIGALAALLLPLSALAAWRRARGAVLRVLLALGLLAILVNPIASDETRKGLNDIAVVLVDRSASQAIGERPAETTAALQALRERLARLPDLDVREVTVASDASGTPLISTLRQALADVPRDRLAGVVALSDGRAADVPPAEAATTLLPTGAPFHLLASGRPGERDRRLTVLEAPSYAVIGKPVTIRIRVDEGDPGERVGGVPAPVTIESDGTAPVTRQVPIGEPFELQVTPARRGSNIFDLSVAPGQAELTPANNRAIVAINGIRERLRVLLVSGEPHMGERVWRNILKSDPSVDLVHFTILRPPQKQDGTPVMELSLIAFPTRRAVL